MTISFCGETAGSVGKVNLNPRRIIEQPNNVTFNGETAGSVGKRDLNTKTPQEEASIFLIRQKY